MKKINIIILKFNNVVLSNSNAAKRINRMAHSVWPGFTLFAQTFLFEYLESLWNLVTYSFFYLVQVL